MLLQLHCWIIKHNLQNMFIDKIIHYEEQCVISTNSWNYTYSDGAIMD